MSEPLIDLDDDNMGVPGSINQVSPPDGYVTLVSEASEPPIDTFGISIEFS